MASQYKKINDVFERELNLLITAHPELSVLQVENQQKRLGDGYGWLRSTLLPSTDDIATLGPGGFTRNHGVMQIDMFYPNDELANEARNRVDIILQAFEYGKVFTDTDFQMVIDSTEVMPAYSIKNYYCIPMRIGYSSWIIRG